MQPVRRRAHARPLLYCLFPAATLGIVGCASPGPPKPPSLHLPRPASGVAAERAGDAVTLRFQPPTLSTDGQMLRDAYVQGSLCRQAGTAAACVPVDTEQTRVPLPLPSGSSSSPVIWTDTLPGDLRSGPPRAISYRIELRNSAGRSAGPSDPIFAAAGSPPPAIQHLQADPMRLGIALRWTPVPGAGEVLLDRTAPPTGLPQPKMVQAQGTTPAPRARHAMTGRHTRSAGGGAQMSRAAGNTPGLTVLQAAPGELGPGYTVDSSALEGVPYTYIAFRREVVQLGGRTLELHSAPSVPVTATWRDLYPPATPSGLTALGYRVPGGKGETRATENTVFAVDLVWQPVNDPRLAGYRISRQLLDAAHHPVGAPELLSPAAVTTPGFHDSTARAGESYRYRVTAIDPKGNESAPAEADVLPSRAPQ